MYNTGPEYSYLLNAGTSAARRVIERGVGRNSHGWHRLNDSNLHWEMRAAAHSAVHNATARARRLRVDGVWIDPDAIIDDAVAAVAKESSHE